MPLDLVKRIEKAIERLQKGLMTGMWQTVISYSTNSDVSTKILQGCLYSEIAKPDSLSYQPLIFDCNAIGNKDQSLIIPENIFDISAETSPKICSFVNTNELSLLFSLPDTNVPGYEIKTGKRYPLSADIPACKNSDSVIIGSICDGDNVLENIPFALSLSNLNKHTFVCGITGSGKTNTVKYILSNTGKPFWVIECAKKEYRGLNLEKPGQEITVYTLGRPEVNCLSFNPFYIMQGISPQMHIDYLKDLFNADFSFYGPMPYIVEKCLHNIYEKRKWNLSLGYHPYLANTKNRSRLFDSEYMAARYDMEEHKYIFPTMFDLKNEIADYVNQMGYDGELLSNIKTAILARLESLCVGAKGFMLNTNEVPDFHNLVKKNIVFELEGLADDSDKAFSVGILIIGSSGNMVENLNLGYFDG
jgi:hypothetical protein